METAKENKGRAPGEITWSFVVPNYNGEKVIGECIEAMLAAGESASTHGEIVVVDDASTDRSLSLLIPYKDKLTLVSLVENRGFSGAVNAGIKRASGRIIFLINNDVRVSSDLIDKAVGHFSDRDVFAVSFHAYDEKGGMRVGRVLPVFKKGFLKGIPDERPEAMTRVSPTFFASGGGAAFDREKLIALGGFDEMMNPFYWEDIDVSYRAWRRGWKVLYDPALQVLHPSHGVILDSFSKSRTEVVSRRNQIVFFWKNVDDASMKRAHRLFLFIKRVTSAAGRNKDFLSAYSQARNLLGRIGEFRKNEMPLRTKTDREIIELITGFRF